MAVHRGAVAEGSLQLSSPVNPTDPTLLDGPWGMTIADNGHTAKIFISDVPSGTVSRFNIKFIGQFSISTEQGCAFGVATSSTGRQFAAVNDITNSVQIWTVRP